MSSSKIENWRSFAFMIAATLVLLWGCVTITWVYDRFVGHEYGSHASEMIFSICLLSTLIGMGWVVARKTSVTSTPFLSSLLAGIFVSIVIVCLEYVFRGNDPEFFQVVVIYSVAIPCLMILGGIFQGVVNYFFR